MVQDLLEPPFQLLLGVLPDPLAEALLRLSLRDQVFLVVTVAIGGLVLLTLLFAVATLIHRYLTERAERRRSELAERFRPLILEALAGDLPVDSVHRTVTPAERELFVDLLMEYAGAVRGEEREVLRRMARSHLEPVARQLFAVAPERRARAVRILGTLGFDEYEEELIQILADPDPTVALVAIQALAERGGARFAEPILERLHRFDDWSARYLAETIASMGPAAAPSVRDAYVDAGANPRTRTIAADALRQIGSSDSADLAAEVLGALGPDVPSSGGPRELVIASMRILLQWGRPEHARMARALRDHPDAVIRAVAHSALGEMGGEEDVADLAKALQDPSRWVALHAARALRSLRANETLERIAEAGGERAVLCREMLAG